ncbi:MAG: hypothetical protein QXS44_00940 [Saccharolobus sp.]|uniref:hypothetical protein n=1 Tax=Saccharolobus sp. TaxID=2100761 RepID=UPI00316264B2
MMLDELIEKLNQFKKELDIDKLKEEDIELDEIIKDLEISKDIMKNVLGKLGDIKKRIDEIDSIEYEERIDEIKEYINKIKDTNNPYDIIRWINEINKNVSNIEREINDRISKLIDEKIRKIEEINEKLTIFARILLNFLKINKDIKIFSIPKDKSLTKLTEIENEATKQLTEINRLVLDELKKTNIDESKLNLLIELIDKGEIKINKNNLNDVTQIIKMLVEKGIVTRVKI